MKYATLLAAAAGLASASAVASSTSAATATPTVALDYCTVVPAQGNSSLGYYYFQNIRYAASPTGDLRFAAPEWPPQETGINSGQYASVDVDCTTQEDCLFLDVWMPADALARNESLPVMVYFFGGGFTNGGKTQSTPEGLFNISTDFIFVAFNYRLGFTGLANGPTYQHQGGTSNLAIWDASHGLEWVRRYIASFGGDPGRVTAAGFSAGASQVMFQLTRFAGRAEQLFDQAYIMSPGYIPGAGHYQAESYWQNVSAAVGCPGGDLSCMRQANWTNLTATGADIADAYGYNLQPRADGYIAADTYEAELYQKHFNFSGPLVISHERHEENSQNTTGIDSAEDVAAELHIYFPGITDQIVDEILTLYPAWRYPSPGLRLSDIRQSFDMTAHNLALTQALNNQTWNARVDLDSAVHGTDGLFYWYSTYELLPQSGLGGGVSGYVNVTVAHQMQKYLLSFVLTGNPNTLWPEDKIHWPQYGNETNTLIFNNTMSITTDDLANDRSLFWNKALWY
ncbi:hypothetical protein ASPZODRAFT_105629 [Penicilliopsis zonata CBS 506.65]|uniref:Carboxylesterase type B domain-containing protein n=1 Tax=Penicilliopsis zonata CBS 506.65 TaxID=1073090 RepID=A0A1L9S4X8_9EURO|nr:hypothetical protein ASPZODRAFT_105629 [Penicilliopsis zonata CBS 506.65]OJJ42201.1 hypothetical protein ASPZODRAFT_105629 [Penicilliopsis zonata CBS 506.65]